MGSTKNMPVDTTGQSVDMNALPAQLFYLAADLQHRHPQIADILARAAKEVEVLIADKSPSSKLPESIKALLHSTPLEHGR